MKCQYKRIRFRMIENTDSRAIEYEEQTYDLPDTVRSKRSVRPAWSLLAGLLHIANWIRSAFGA